VYVEIPSFFSEREWLIARMVLNSNRDEGQEYVEKLKDEEFAYTSRDEVRVQQLGLFFSLIHSLTHSHSLTQLLSILDGLTATDFQCFDISEAVDNFTHAHLPGLRTRDGLPANTQAKCTVRTDLERGFRYE
jgi:hypothetical protein